MTDEWVTIVSGEVEMEEVEPEGGETACRMRQWSMEVSSVGSGV